MAENFVLIGDVGSGGFVNESESFFGELDEVGSAEKREGFAAVIKQYLAEPSFLLHPDKMVS